MSKDYMIITGKMEKVITFIYRFNYYGGLTQNNDQYSDLMIFYLDSKRGICRNELTI